MKRLIVNADDFGRTSGVNRGIVEAHQRGIVTSTSLMVAHAAAEEAAAMAKENPSLGVGLHVAVTGGPAALPPNQAPSLIGPKGALPRSPEWLGGADPQDVLAEVRAQVRRFRELMGRLPTHLDSHHHAHRLPAVFEAVVVVAWELGLPVRRASSDMGEALRVEGLASPDHFVDTFYGEGATLETLVRAIEGLGPGTTELMCHPAVVDDELRTGSSYAEPRAAELRALTAPEVRQAVQKAGATLIGFAAL